MYTNTRTRIHHAGRPNYTGNKLGISIQIVNCNETSNALSVPAKRKVKVFEMVSRRPQTLFSFYAPQLVPAGTAEARISYGNSVCLSVCLSRPGGIPRPGETETPGLHHMVAWSI